MKVDFMIIGAQKSGTTSLASLLSSHPQVCFCANKEPGYFNTNTTWQTNLKKYHSLFKPQRGQILGEASTMYSMRPDFENTQNRIYEYNPEIRLIYIMRDPVVRIASHYAHRYVRKRVGEDMQNEVLNNPMYVDRSKYYYQISPYIEQFNSEQVLLLFFEEFIKNPQQSMVKVSQFLNIDSSFYLNQTSYSRKNATSNRLILADGSTLGKLVAPVKRIRRFLPESLVNFGLKILGSKISSNPEFPESLKKELYQLTLEDRTNLETYIGKEILAWKRY